jgi:hypothetical protein
LLRTNGLITGQFFTIIYFLLLDSGAVIYDKPFTCVTLPNFISDEKYFKELKQELLKLNFNEKSNDLYKFKQVFSNYNLFV